MKGPIDYIIVGFDGSAFDGSILKALETAVDDGVIGLVALIFVSKDKLGNITTLDVDENHDVQIVEFAGKYNLSSDYITSDDFDEVGELLDRDTSAGLLVVEQLWAIPLKQALAKTGGYLLAEGRIHPQSAQELAEEDEDEVI